MWSYLWHGPLHHVHGRSGDPAGSGFLSGVAREAGDGHGGHGPHTWQDGGSGELGGPLISARPKAPRITFRTTGTQRCFHSRRAWVMTANCRFRLCQRTSGQCRSFRLIAIWGQSLSLGLAMGGEIAPRANAGQAATHALSCRLLGNEGLPQWQGLRGYEVSAPGGDVGRSSGPQLQRLTHGANLGESLPWLIGRRPQLRDGSPTKRHRRN